MTQTLTKEIAADTLGERAISICVLDDDPEMIEVLRDTLGNMGFGSKGTTDPLEAIEAVRSGGYRVVISDMKMPQMDGRAFLEAALKIDPGVQVILMSGHYSLDAAVEAIKRGAYDYLAKPVDRARLRKTLDELNDLFGQRKRIRELESRMLDDLNFHGIIGKSPAMYEVFDLARKVAKHYTNVLITGQTGTGKELVAHAIHHMSPVAQQKFAVCNCSALVDTLLESQLFGHIRGAFTGATETRPGLFEYANGGTVFLDEVGEMSLGMQAKLLRVIQNREIQRVGSPEVRRVDVRLVAATNRDLRAEVVAGRFREDLYYRLSTVQIRVPSLAERLEDVPLLVQAFLKKYNAAYHKQILGLSRRAQTVMLQYNWPGNVRELDNVISGACIRATGEFIDLAEFPENLQRPAMRAANGEESWRALPLEEIKRVHIERVLQFCKDNRVKAAQLLGIGRTSLYRHLKRTAKQSAKSAAAFGA
ncbi:MAG TPA: sigma-54 dependent transcriptional regulator [Candidatus Acidoferrales bacterium]|nr:sigma-54 dependent transcriptional regulator [Candidatus Acidoferrales bacterium]